MENTAAIAPQDITGLILAGGRGSRMGGVDKGLQLFRQEMLAFHVMGRMAPQVGAMMINANQNGASYQALCSRLQTSGVTVRPDELAGFAGPLAGLQTGLKHCRTAYLLSAPCDSPFLPMNLASRLSQALLEQQADLAVAVTGVAGQVRVHRVFSLMKAGLLPHLTAFLEQGGRKVGAWHASLNVAQVHFDDEMAFYNINTLEELRQLEPNA
ncbi:molybdenum cofactor guanylyltransferase MobA [Undibacterium sp.]|jgi:molybdopterin-guanine dinucleotide biosynthesis protein A|uniref:molybdenum cofactor guanylyltransferase MobA n=1 Tax=Undibacterium sp. TaxID=1914977 RepID=UPI002CDB74FD|nr:molybdenum cofactor guanylyltransferase MobA [Undibacterium sp.]HTD07240.1 molybdenum cofactor guanylyltransferase MobA [Undibacterium sp.]